VQDVNAGKPADDPDRATEGGAEARLRRWGFNVVGGEGGRRLGGQELAYLAAVEFCTAGPLIHAHGVRLPDVFDREWPRRAQDQAEAMCRPLAQDTRLLGWLTDTESGWAQPGDEAEARPTLLQVCLSLEPGFAAYHAAWEFVLALHGGQLAAVGRAWGVPLANREVVRELTRTERGLGSRGYLRDQARWSGEFARRYFSTTAAAIRAVDPNHLVLGCRSSRPLGPAVSGTGVAPVLDVVLLDWRELPVVHPAAGAAAPMPVLAGNFCWVDRKFLSPATAGRWHELTSVERMLRRGRAAFARVARHPAVCGYLWPQWQDAPGEQPPFARGLVHGNGAEAREHTELLADLNARAEALHRATPRTTFP
jgi:agarase